MFWPRTGTRSTSLLSYDQGMPVDEILLFASVAEFQSRPRYEAALTASEDELDRIVGKYQLPKPRMAWIRCGLNGCTEPHRFGYVIRLTDGRETHCGSTCGANKFGVKWQELEATAKALEEAKALENVVEELRSQRLAMLARATELIEPSARVESRLDSLRRTLKSNRPVWRRVEECARLGGSIRVEVDSPPGGDSYPSSRSTQMRTIAQLDGARLLLAEVTYYSNVLRNYVVPSLKHLDAAISSAQGSKALQAISRDGAKLNASIESADRQVALGARLFAPGNREKLEHVVTKQLAARDVTPELRRMLDEAYKI